MRTSCVYNETFLCSANWLVSASDVVSLKGPAWSARSIVFGGEVKGLTTEGTEDHKGNRQLVMLIGLTHYTWSEG